jgi:hypothetical protein
VDDNDHYDFVDFGRPPRRRIAPSARRAIVAGVALLAIAGAVRWLAGGSSPTTSVARPAATSSGPGGRSNALDGRSAGAPAPSLHAGTHHGYGSEDAGPTFWLEFDVLPPSTTLAAVTASVGPMSGLANGRVFFYRPADGKIDIASGTFGAHASLRTLPAGVGFTAVVIWTPTCTAMPPLQEVGIRVSYTAAGGTGVLDLVGAPDVPSTEVGAQLAACVHGPH